MDDFPALVNTPEYHAYVRNLKAWRRKYFPTKATLAFVAISPSFEPRRIFRGAADPKKVFYFYNPYRRGHLRRGIYSALMKAPKLEPSVKNILGHGLK